MAEGSEVRNKALFISKLENSVDDLFSIDKAFILISIKVGSNADNKGVSEAFGLISKHIKKAIVNQKDCYSFWDNTFYILTYLDNKSIVQKFINSLALTLEKRYDKEFFLKSACIQYPYDVIDVENIFEKLKEKEVNVVSAKSDIEASLISDQDSNLLLGKELAKYLNLIQQYSDVLYNHCLFVAKVSVGIAKALNLPKPVIKKIVIASVLHDVGYLCIPQKNLINPANYDEKTITLVKMHPLLATRNVLKEKSIFKGIFGFIEQHHEYLDGTGYPFGLLQQDLSLEAQIISIADTYDLIRHQKGISTVEIVDFFRSRVGIRWDAKLITVFSAILMDIKQFDNLTSTQESSLLDFLTWI